MDERSYWLGFSVFPGVGPGKFGKLLENFGSAKEAWIAKSGDLKAALGPALTEKFITFRHSFDLAHYREKLSNHDVVFLTLIDDAYPSLLKQIKNPPFVLYVRGSTEILGQAENVPSTGSGQANYIAIVGTRKITEYGREVTANLTMALVQAGCAIVSGLALGVDAVSHRTTIESGGKTIAVLGCGVDCCSPGENLALYNSIIASGGAIVSEFPLSQIPTKGSFPSRNRIIAGLSVGVVVTEGAEDSGALITAKDAFENRRKVFAVPGPITSSLSKGPNSLLAKGAKLVTSAEDILSELGLSLSAKRFAQSVVKGETEEEQKIIDLLQHESLHFDELVRRSGLDSSKVGVVLSMMELKGIIKTLQTGSYILS